ncbi:hypothetical protein MOX02_19710 [Methylobacterium oxalidis]|uniref:Uncharacterized protein n=2 Tax=Methylobacterium oxalidis TaxID=944322 RepID=A0A512J1Y3_9HYPH|nr:hypothetical protein MOX02_19710 [Methylobacterium oxalidis]GLS63965.1 hypothetical protein GCM10007888_23460 [Methylobacterium oxalidis]
MPTEMRPPHDRPLREAGDEACRRASGYAADPEWTAYGIRDAIVFVTGFLVALMLISPHG